MNISMARRWLMKPTSVPSIRVSPVIPRDPINLPYGVDMTTVLEELKWSPDASSLFTQEFHCLFDYGNMMQGHSEDWRLKAPGVALPFMWKAYTKHPYSMWVMDQGYKRTPVVLPPQDEGHPMWSERKRSGLNRSPPAKVKGELYLVSPGFILELDKLRRNGLEYDRTLVTVQIPTRKVVWLKDPSLHPVKGPWNRQSTETTDFHITHRRAFMYVGKENAFEIDGGFRFKPADVYVPNKTYLTRYFWFKEG